MATAFDPYRKWLGIPPKDQPPHLYRLLGIDPFESDPDVISAAADGRMAQLKTVQAGRYSELSQKLLNEIATARVTLLNPEKKAAYDAQLRAQLARHARAESAAVPSATTPDAKSTAADTAATAGKPGAAAAPTLAGATGSAMPAVSDRLGDYLVARRARRRVSPAIIVPVGLVALTLIFVGAWAVGWLGDGRRADGPVAAATGSPGTIPRMPNEQSKPARTATLSGAAAGTPGGAASTLGEPAGPSTESATATSAGAGEESPNEPAPPCEDDPSTECPLDELIDPESELPTDASAPPATPVKPSPAVATKPSVPDTDARRPIDERLRELFGKELQSAKTSSERRALGEKLFAQAGKFADDPVARYVAAEMACRLAAEAGEIELCGQWVDWLAERYAVSALAMKAEMYEKLLAALPAGDQSAATVQNVVKKAGGLARDAARADDYDTADRLARLALSAARRTRDPALLREATNESRELDRQRARYGAVRAALEALAEKPDDPAANLAVGRWYCFVHEDWAKGLPALVKGEDAELAELARDELESSSLSGAEAAARRAALADRWLALAAKQRGADQPAMESRARDHYAAALPELTGLEKLRVEKQLDEMAAAAAKDPSSTSRSRGLVAAGNVALASNGATIEAKPGLANAGMLIDGKTDRGQPGGPYQFAYQRWPCEWVIRLPQVYRLQEIRVLLYDLPGPRPHNYRVELSPDGEHFNLLVDRSEGRWASWQILRFPPQPVRAIKFIGLWCEGDVNFCVYEIEAYCVPPSTTPR